MSGGKTIILNFWEKCSRIRKVGVCRECTGGKKLKMGDFDPFGAPAFFGVGGVFVLLFILLWVEDENFSLIVFVLKMLGQFCHWLLARQVVAKLKHPKMMRSCTWAKGKFGKKYFVAGDAAREFFATEMLWTKKHSRRHWSRTGSCCRCCCCNCCCFCCSWQCQTLAVVFLCFNRITASVLVCFVSPLRGHCQPSQILPSP